MMKEMFKKYFALTEQGAGDLVKATFASLSVYIINIFPLILLMLIADGLILGNTKSGYLYIVLSVVILIAMYILLSIQYDSLYNATYKESANLRIQIVEILKELPLSYFSKHDVADISQTVMSGVEAVEHAMSHAMAMTAGFFIFFPIFTALLLWGNVFLGLAVILPVLLNFILIWLSKKMQLRENLKYYKKLRDNSDYFQETIELQQDIKSFGLSEKIKCLLYKKNGRKRKNAYKSGTYGLHSRRIRRTDLAAFSCRCHHYRDYPVCGRAGHDTLSDRLYTGGNEAERICRRR